MVDMADLTKLDKLLVYMGDRVWRFTDLRKMFYERIDFGAQYNPSSDKRFSELLRRAKMRGFILRPETGRYIVSKAGKKFIMWVWS